MPIPGHENPSIKSRSYSNRLRCLVNPFCHSKPSKSRSTDLYRNTSATEKPINMESNTLSLESPVFQTSRVRFMDSMTMFLVVNLKEHDKVAFSVGKNGNEPNECRKVVMTNKDVLKMMNTGRKFQPTVISKETKENLHGLWMQVTSETKFEELEKKIEEQELTQNPKVPLAVLILAKKVSIIIMSIIASAILSFLFTDGVFQLDPLLSSFNTSTYLNAVLWISFAAFTGLVFTINEIIDLKWNESAKNKHDFMVEVKVVLEKWSSEKIQSVSERMSKYSQTIHKLPTNGFSHNEHANHIQKTTNSNTHDRKSGSQTSSNSSNDEPEVDYPVRFLRAAKGDPVHGRTRYEDTMAWRKEQRMDTILDEPFVFYQLVKKYYPHFYHLRGRNNEPVYYESPAKTDLKKLKKAGMKMEDLLRYYALVTEYMWQRIEPTEEGKSIYVIDLDGIGIMDFVGDVIDFVRKTSSFTGAHYPERSGTIFVINVPSWFNVIWKVVSPMADEVTRRKIRILRGKKNILDDLLTRIELENIPSDYGGLSMPLGQSPEEKMFSDDMKKNLQRADLSPVT